MPTKLPLKPKHKRYDLTEAEMRALRNVIVFGEDKKEMYKVFVRPDMVTSPALLKRYSDDFYNRSETRDFIRDYSKTLEGVQAEEEQERATPLTPEEQASKAVGKFKSKVYEKMGESLETVEEMDTIAKLGDRIGAFDNEEERVEAPRRYIPARCFSDCKYRFWAEQVVKTGDAIDCCEYCRALEYAKERGFVYDPTKLLDLPNKEEK